MARHQRPRRAHVIALATALGVLATSGGAAAAARLGLDEGATAATTATAAAPTPALPPLPAPLTDAAAWLEGPVQDVTDPAVGAVALGSGFLAVPERALATLAATPPTEDGFRALAQDAYDSLLHMKPDTPFTHALDTGHPAWTPDWDHDGVWGEAEDYDHDVDSAPDVAAFRYVCNAPDGTITFVTPDGTCAADGTSSAWATGVAREVRIVDARGFILDATVWLPGAALREPCATVGFDRCADPGNVLGRLPSVVFVNGLASRQDHYYWYAVALARAGYAVLTFDPAGQGESEGTAADVFAQVAGCGGHCMDAQDAVRWWTGDPVADVDAGQRRPFLGFHDPAPVADGGDNVANPYLGSLDLGRVGLSGNSMGAAATVSYLNAVTDGRGYDRTGRPVPPIAAAVAMSIPGETRISAPVPVLGVTGDMDGLPLVGPALLGLGWADDHERMFAHLRADPATAGRSVGVVVIEGGIHTDHVDQPFVGSTPWGLWLTERYALAWMDCHVSTGDCGRVFEPSEHLSHAYPSQVDPDASGPAANACLQAPDRASLGQDPETLLAALAGTPLTCAP